MSDDKDKSSEPAAEGPAPKAVVNRLSLYLRELQHLVRDGHETTSSSQLGSLLGFTDAQVRKDLAYFGHFGYPGIGYRCDELIVAIRRILGTDQHWPVAIVGTGNLGRALLGYKGFGNQNFRIVAAFERRSQQGRGDYRRRAGVSFRRVRGGRQATSHPPGDDRRARGIGSSRGRQARRLPGVEGIVNFAPVTITLPEGVTQVGVDLAIELEQLSFAVARRKGEGAEG